MIHRENPLQNTSINKLNACIKPHPSDINTFCEKTDDAPKRYDEMEKMWAVAIAPRDFESTQRNRLTSHLHPIIVRGELRGTDASWEVMVHIFALLIIRLKSEMVLFRGESRI